MKEESTNAGGNKTRRNRDSHRSMPAKTSTFNDSIGLDLTAKKITRPAVNAGLSSHAGAGANTERQYGNDEAVRSSFPKVMDRTPIVKEFASKNELEQAQDKTRLSDYQMYWHLREFDPIDMIEELDIEEKYKRKQKIEAMLQKFRDLPESEHIRKFIQFERLNYKTQLYNKSRKIDSIMKQLNSGNQHVEKDENGLDMMGFTKDGKKKFIYGPKIQLQKEIGQLEDDNYNL